MWIRTFTVKMGKLPEERSSFKSMMFSEIFEFNPNLRKCEIHVKSWGKYM